MAAKVNVYLLMMEWQVSDGLVPCPHCNRRFNQKAAERHIPKCKDIKAKPRTLRRGAGTGAVQVHLKIHCLLLRNKVVVVVIVLIIVRCHRWNLLILDHHHQQQQQQLLLLRIVIITIPTMLKIVDLLQLYTLNVKNKLKKCSNDQNLQKHHHLYQIVNQLVIQHVVGSINRKWNVLIVTAYLVDVLV